jgi:hypothetical protein
VARLGRVIQIIIAENAQFPEIDLFFAAFWIFLVAAIKDG